MKKSPTSKRSVGGGLLHPFVVVFCSILWYYFYILIFILGVFIDTLFKDFLNDFKLNKRYLFTNPFSLYKGLFDLQINNYAIVYKLYPNLKQINLIYNNINVSRFVYNKTLEYNIFAFKQLGKSLTPKVTDLKCDFPFLNLVEFDSLACANAQQDLRNAWKMFFNEHLGFPKFKKKNSSHSRFRFFL